MTKVLVATDQPFAKEAVMKIEEAVKSVITSYSIHYTKLYESAFNAMGEVLSSPAYRPLDLYVVMLEDNRLKVDLSKAVKRSDFNIKQIFYHS